MMNGGTDEVRTRAEAVTRRPAGVEVARLAEVSQKTVSRVFNGEQYVSQAVRDRVLWAAQELGYQPNRAARALNSGRSRRIGVVWLGSALFGPVQMLVALEKAARDLGYSVSLAATDEGEVGGVEAAIEALLAEGIDGLVLSEPVDNRPLLRLTAQVPVITFDHFDRPAVIPMTDVEIGGQDLTAAAALATRHLLDLGHRTVHHVSGPRAWWSARDRERGWRQALEEAGREIPELLEGDWSAASGYAAGCVLLAQPSVTAVFAANDEMALGVIRAQIEAGRRVPDDVSVVGIDDMPGAAYFTPPLTTIRQQFDVVIPAAVRRLVSRIEGTSSPAEFAHPEPQIVLRSSTAPPPA